MAILLSNHFFACRKTTGVTRYRRKGLNLLQKIQVRDFNYITDASKKTVQGFIAQELYGIYPQAVTVGGDDPTTKPWQVDYSKMTPLLVKSVQELQQENDSKDIEITQLKSRADQAEAKLQLLITLWCQKDPNAEICR
jgi:hypothetical protein